MDKRNCNKTIILGDGLYQTGYVYNMPGNSTEVRKRYMFNGQIVAERHGNSIFFALNDHLGGVVTSFGGSWGTNQTRRDTA